MLQPFDYAGGPSADTLLADYMRLHKEHPHHLLPLEKDLPPELQVSSRDLYRATVIMVLSDASSDLHLCGCLGRLFHKHPNFGSFNDDWNEEYISMLLGKMSGGGIGLGDRLGNNGYRLIRLLSGYFGKWQKQVIPANIESAVQGLSPKWRGVVEAYCIGKDALPLDTPALKALRDLYPYYGSLGDHNVRDDIQKKVRGKIPLVNYHEVFRFLGQTKKGNCDEVIIGWNAWRLLSSKERHRLGKRWIRDNLVKDDRLTDKLWTFYSSLPQS